MLVVDSAVQNRLSDDCLSAIPTLIVTGVPTLDGALDGALEFGEAVAAQPDTPPDREIDGEIDPAAPVAMTFTGGTTGRPEGGGGQSHGALRLGSQHRPRATKSRLRTSSAW